MIFQMLYFEPTVKLMIAHLMAMEGHPLSATRDADEAFRAIERSEQSADGRCILLVDNFWVNPVAREALTQLAAIPALRRRVYVIGLSAWTGDAIAKGWVDTVIDLPVHVVPFLDALQAGIARLSTK